MTCPARNHCVHRKGIPIQLHQKHSREIANGDHCDGNRHGCESDCEECTSDGYVGDCEKNDDGANEISHAAAFGQNRGNRDIRTSQRETCGNPQRTIDKMGERKSES